MPLNGQLNSTSIYISLKSRPKPGEYHWGLILSSSDDKPVLHHATNIKGPWVYETLQDDPAHSISLIALIRVADVESRSLAKEIIQRIPADGSSSRRTGEPFTCRIWIKDALMALYDNGIIRLPSDIDTIESKAVEYGLVFAPISEAGDGPTVINNAFKT